MQSKDSISNDYLYLYYYYYLVITCLSNCIIIYLIIPMSDSIYQVSTDVLIESPLLKSFYY